MNAVVTGAFGYTGRYIAERLLDDGHEVRTLTNDDSSADPFAGHVKATPLIFDHTYLTEQLRGADVLFNTYWIRFERGDMTFDRATRNSYALIDAAREAGVRRLVHVSITNPFIDPRLPYFRGKAAVEGAVMASGLSYGIVRPTVVFGGNDVFINNIAWLVRHIPVFFVPTGGSLQPVHVADVAALCVQAADESRNTIVDAAGPEAFTFGAFVRTVRDAVGSRTLLVSTPPSVALLGARVVGALLRDRVMTRGELDGLRAGLVVSGEQPTGSVVFTEWLTEHTDELGQRYVSEVRRNFHRDTARGRRPVDATR